MKKITTLIFALISLSTFAVEYKVDSIKVYKTQHKMDMMFEGKVTKTYTVMLGRGGMGPKVQEGDKKVPEGEYFLDLKNPYSSFFKSIHITYPNLEDEERAKKMGVNPGFDIFIHGMPTYFTELSTILDDETMKLSFGKKGDWTAGCIAVQNYQMQEIWDNINIDASPMPITIVH